LVNLLTRGEKKHIINTKDRCGPGGPLCKLLICLPDGLGSVPEHKFVSPVTVAPVRGWGRGNRIAGT
jgi:hypothetical protein